jgi:hypothetical protein
MTKPAVTPGIGSDSPQANPETVAGEPRNGGVADADRGGELAIPTVIAHAIRRHDPRSNTCSISTQQMVASGFGQSSNRHGSVSNAPSPRGTLTFMMFLEFLVAAVVGGLAGLLADQLLRRRHSPPRGLAALAGIVAGVGGTAAAQAARDEPLGPILMICAPLFFAGIALAVIATRLSEAGDGPSGGARH